MAAPSTLKELREKLIEQAINFGFVDKERGQLRDCIFDKSTLAQRTPAADDNNFWFGFIREGEPTSKAYEGLSFVVFPESSGSHCVVSIGIGSSTTADGSFRGGSLGPDMDLALKLSFARSFRSLTKDPSNKAKFFFKLNFTETISPTPELKEELETPSYDDVMINTVAEYDHKDRGGLLPAAMLVDYTSQEGYNLIVSWLAQYAKWRNWSSYNNGSVRKKQNNAIEEAIKKCLKDKECLAPKDVLDILKQKRFIVLQGAPGCGKTWTANELSKDPFFFDTKFIQFHAETSYADFIYGIKPVLDGKSLAYCGHKGVLLDILDDALKEENKDKKFLLIIDEINRANLANVLGPVFYLFEQTAKNRTHKLNLGLDKDEKPIEYDHIPDNLYVVATMNTADKSLAVVDFALRRRFTWVTLRPHELKLDTDSQYDFDDKLFLQMDTIFNEYATDEELNLQPGQSYYIYPVKRTNIEAFNEYRRNTIKYGLMPLIKEYLSEGYLLAAKNEFAQLFYSYGSDLIMYE